MAKPIPPQVQLEETYNAAADSYDLPPLSFWDRFGRRTVDRMPLSPGMTVLDVCCGTGGSGMPAAERVGPTGRVIAVDLAENLLRKGSHRAAQRGLGNIEFRRADLENLPFADEAFDAVICVFGIFFVPDLHGAVRGLWRLVRPSGALAITIWGPNQFQPADGIFWEAVKREDPELHSSIKSWSKIVEPEPLRALLVECGISDPKIVTEPGTHPLVSPEDWWTILLGSGYRSTINALSPERRERVRLANLEGVNRSQIRELRADVIYAIALRPARPTTQASIEFRIN